jgi:O-antigen ligase
MRLQLRLLLIPLGLLGFWLLFLELQRRPGWFANTKYLGALLAVEVVLACLWRFDKVFFPVTMGCFLLAGTSLPLAGESTTVRWLFLGVGGVVGLVIWMKANRAHHFGLFHLVALFCVFAALASASASSGPQTALLKVMSLFLLFLYASTGGRVALDGKEASFLRGLILACEVLVYISSACYLALGYDLFGNYNALGAIIGVGATPVLLWGALVTANRGERKRRYIALALCGALLYVSVCRAAILADTVVIVALTIALRRPGLLLKAAFIGALFLEGMAVANPAHMSAFVGSLTERLVFKGGRDPSHPGVFGSRETPWGETISAVKHHPYFGTGFGTSDPGIDQPYRQGTAVSDEGTNREHGDSYLALVEYMGLLGILPFLFLLVMLIRASARVFAWMRRTGSPHHYAVPFVLIVVAGLVHAIFEDWLLAVGSYLCVFFWVAAFLLIDGASEINASPRTFASKPFVAFAPATAPGRPAA